MTLHPKGVCSISFIFSQLFWISRQKELELLDDASTDLMIMSEDDKKPVMLVLGEAFLEVTESEATEFCESQVDKLQAKLDKYQAEEQEITTEQAKLKSILYGRFGNSINLEDK